MLLADLGAEVVKVERPQGGDPARRLQGFFRSINRGKKSLTLDLKVPSARDILYRLVETADVFTEGFRPGVAARLGIDHQTLARINPGLVYCSISGYGQDGPYRDMPGHDLNYLAMSGMLEAFKDRAGRNIHPHVAVGDLSSGMFAALGIMAALMARNQSGAGQYVDVSMFDGLLLWTATRLGTFFETGTPERTYDPGYGVYYDRDGRPFTLGIAHEDWFWERLCDVVGLGEYRSLTGAERRERGDELSKKLQNVFALKTAEEWLKRLREADVPAAPVQGAREVVSDPHVAFRKMIQEIPMPDGSTNRQVAFPVKLSDTPAAIQGPPPELGQHTEEILVRAGYSAEEVERFRREGAV